MKLIALLTVCVLAALTQTSFAADDAGSAGKTLYHVVSFKYKEGATPEQIKAVDDAFAALKGQIPGILTLNYGDNVSPEKHSHGYTQCFVLTFGVAADRDAYLIHPAHKAFGKVVGPCLAEVMVIDFWAK